MQALLNHPAVQAGLAPFVVALIVAELLLRMRLSGLAIIAGFAVTVTCTTSTFINGAPPAASSYVLKSTAVTGTYGQPGYVRRVVSGTYSSAT